MNARSLAGTNGGGKTTPRPLPAHPATGTGMPGGEASLEERYAKILGHNTTLAANLSKLRQQIEELKSAGPAPAADPAPAAAPVASRRADAGLQAELDRRFEELAALTRMLEEHGQAHAAHIATLEAQAQELTLYAASVEQALVQMQASTAWRLTAPLRWLMRLLRRQPRPKPFRPRFFGK